MAVSEHRKQYYRDYMRRRRAETREWLLALKEGQPCVDCGEVYPPVVMDYHHEDPTTKVATIHQLARVIAPDRSRLMAEIEKCVLLCANCHRIREWGDPDEGPCESCDELPPDHLFPDCKCYE